MKIPPLFSGRGLSLAAKFNLNTMTLIVLTAAGVAAFILTAESRHSKVDLLNRGISLAGIMARQSEYGVYTEDEAALTQVLDNALADPDIIYAAVLAGDMRVIKSSSRSDGTEVPTGLYGRRSVDARPLFEEMEGPGGRFFDILTPVVSGTNVEGDISRGPAGEVVVGYLQIGLSRERIHRRIRQFTASTIAVTVMLVLAGIVLTLATTRKIVAPIKELTAASLDIAEQRYESNVLVGGGGEIADLTRAFNVMLGRLRDYRTEVEQRTADIMAANVRMKEEISERQSVEKALQRARDELEIRIQERTSDLESSVEELKLEIGERRRAEMALLENESRLKSLSQEFDGLLNAIPDGLLLLSPDRTILWANRAVSLFQPDAPSSFTGRHCCTVLHGSDGPCESCPVERSFTTGLPQTEIIGTADGRTLDLRTFPIHDASGVVKVIEVVQDVTERHHLEHQLRHSQKMEAVGHLAGGVAHDFNNLLTAIMGYSDILLMKMSEDDPLRGKVEQIIASSKRAAILTQSLLAFSRKQILNPRSVDLNGVVANVDKLLRRLVSEDIELRFNRCEEDLVVVADSTQLEQVMMNLATNARDATKPGGTITVETSRLLLDEEFVRRQGRGEAGDYALLTISDTGSGMSRETVEKAFEPFFTTKQTGRGTGLGLSIVYGIVQQHKGLIDIVSEPGRGTSVHIYLPLTGKKAAMEPEMVAPEVRRGSETILLAEDDAIVRDLVREVLLSHGYSVIIASDGEEAIAQYRRHAGEIGLYLSDVVMPRKNGREAYEEMEKINPGLKVLFMSGYTADIIHRKGILDEEVNFIPKPISPKDLLAKVRSVIDQP